MHKRKGVIAALVLAGSALCETSEHTQSDPWAFSASAYSYFVPDDRNYVQPTLMADRDWLHLELRYNYEAINTASAWVGYNFTAGQKLTLELTPMLGVAFGDTNGIAPGCKVSLSYGKFALYSESEYVIDFAGSTRNFLYNWSELTYAPTGWLRAGLVMQRTRAYQTKLDVQRGLLLGASYKNLELASYLFNLGWDRPTTVFSIGIKF